MGNVTINKLNGGLGRESASIDGVAGLVVPMPSITGGAQSGQTYKLLSLADAETLLITQDHDETTEYLVWEHIKDFFRINPSGTLYLYIVPTTTATFAAGVALGVQALLTYTNGNISIIGCAYNGVIPTTSADALAAIAQAQTEAATAETNSTPIHILVDGVKCTIADDVRALNSPNVTPVAGQNLEVVNFNTGATGTITPAVTEPWEFHTAVGLALGTLAKAAVNESIAWVEKFNLTGGNLTVAAIGGASIVGQASTLSTMEANGFLFMKTYNGYSGIYWNGAPTATAITDDYATIQNNRVINKATRLIRESLMPYLNSPINVDPSTGQLAPAVVKNFENVGRRSLDTMSRNEEFSSATVTIDPAQNILSTDELVMELEIVPTGTSESIVVNVRYANPFN